MKKIIALMLSMMLAVMMLSTAVFAEEAEETAAEEAVAEEAAAEDETAEEETEAAVTIEVPLSENGEMTMEDYSTIEIAQSAVEVTDEEVEEYMDSVVSYATTSETVTEGVVEEGDNVNIAYSGVLEGEEEPFDGGTSEGYDVILGSGSFIDGFEEQIIGHEIGETFDINVTFPEDYTEELSGKNATFTITINYKTVTVVPELTDEFVKSFSEENLDTVLNSVEELKEYTYNYLYTNYLQSALLTALQEKAEIISYNEEQFNLLKDYSAESLAYQASVYAAYGYDEDLIAQLSGYSSAEDYTSSEAMYYLDIIMVLDKVAEDYNIEVTDEEVDDAITAYLASYGYDSVYTTEEFKELSGDAWVLLISKLQVEYEKVMDVAAENVEFIEDVAEEVPAEDTEEIAAEETLADAEAVPAE